MKREVRPEELEKLYRAGDMAKTDCGGCHGCSACCRGMGSSVILDPYDMYQLEKGLGTGPQALLEEGPAQWNLSDGLILPSLVMTGEQEECVFLDGQGRCRIHEFRPGLCRLFPLGRYYEGEQFWYYVQLYECPKPVKTKVKVEKWLGIPQIKKYEEFTRDWHSLLMRCREAAGRREQAQDGTVDARRRLSLYLMNAFYIAPYDTGADFYAQFAGRMEKAGSDLAALLVQ